MLDPESSRKGTIFLAASGDWVVPLSPPSSWVVLEVKKKIVRVFTTSLIRRRLCKVHCSQRAVRSSHGRFARWISFTVTLVVILLEVVRALLRSKLRSRSSAFPGLCLWDHRFLTASRTAFRISVGKGQTPLEFNVVNA